MISKIIPIDFIVEKGWAIFECTKCDNVKKVQYMKQQGPKVLVETIKLD